MDWYSAIRYFLSAVLVLLIPGGALLAWLPDHPARSLGEKRSLLATLADAAALSIAISTLIGLWLFVARLPVSGLVVAGLYGLCLVALLAALISRGVSWPGWRSLVGSLLGLLLLAALIAWRFYQARSLALPAWVDSVQHTLIVRKILEYGGVPPDLTPYVNVPLYYHFGFHLITALFAFWSGLSPDRAVLWFGQVINALVALSVYRLAYALQRRITPAEENNFSAIPPIWAAGAAALLTVFAFQMPAYYLTWGRYTLLTGLILLGPALAAALDIWRAPTRWDAWLRLALLIAGLSLAHYFALLLAGLFLLVMGLFWLGGGILHWRIRRREYWSTILRLLSATFAGILLVLPWIIRVYVYSHRMAGVQMISPIDQTEAAAASASSYLQYLTYLIGPRRNYYLLGIAAAGLLLGLRRANLRLLAAWAVLLGLFSLPWGLRISPFRPDHFAIILFFPAALLVATLLADGAAALGKAARPWAGQGVLAFIIGLLVFWGARETQNIINPVTVFADKADVAALDWVKTHTSPTARFYINSTPWQGNVSRGVDGGSWLEPYAGRETLIPPIVYGFGGPDLINQINGWVGQSQKLTGCTPDFWNLVRETGLTYVYVRQGVGNLQPQTLSECPRLKVVYQQSGIYIYAILPPG